MSRQIGTIFHANSVRQILDCLYCVTNGYITLGLNYTGITARIGGTAPPACSHVGAFSLTLTIEP